VFVLLSWARGVLGSFVLPVSGVYSRMEILVRRITV